MADPPAAGFHRIPGDKARRYVHDTTGEIISRRQYDVCYGRLHAQGFRSNEEQAAARKQAGLPPGPGRGRRGRTRPGGADVVISKRGQWLLASFETIEEARAFARGIQRGRGLVVIFVTVLGILRPGMSGGGDEPSDPEYRTVMPSTDRDSIHWDEVQRESSLLFREILLYTVYWRIAAPPPLRVVHP